MAVLNTTYNFNQPNMNFGQALLYGAFGSLTGGYGCFGGGYGMGMGGSLFSMMGMGMGGYGCGFGGFGMGCYSDQMIGAQAGLAASQVLIGGLIQTISGRGGRGGNDNNSISSKIETVESNAKTHLNVLNEGSKTYSLKNNDFKSASINNEPKYQQAIDDANKAIDDVNNVKLPPLQAELKNLKEPKQSDFQKLKAGSTTEYENDVTAYQKALADYNSKKTELNNQIKELEDSIKESGKLGKALKEAKDAKSTRETAIKNAVEALKPLKEEYDKLIAEQKKENEARIYDAADGNWLNRASKSKVDDYENGECSKSMIRKAFNLFIENKDNDPSQAAKYAKKILNMHDGNKSLFDKNYDSAYKQVLSWKNDHLDLFD